jgi:hypothetical protein
MDGENAVLQARRGAWRAVRGGCLAELASSLPPPRSASFGDIGRGPRLRPRVDGAVAIPLPAGGSADRFERRFWQSWQAPRSPPWSKFFGRRRTASNASFFPNSYRQLHPMLSLRRSWEGVEEGAARGDVTPTRPQPPALARSAGVNHSGLASSQQSQPWQRASVATTYWVVPRDGSGGALCRP